ncbi:MAG: hypothetical protein ACFB15_24135 [Cyclobacteriaceae bacterium]
MDGYLDQDGKYKFSSRMINKIYDLENEFRSKILLEPKRTLTSDQDWFINFVECPGGKFMIDVYTDDANDYQSIAAVVSSRIDRKRIDSFWKKAKNEYFGF